MYILVKKEKTMAKATYEQLEAALRLTSITDMISVNTVTEDGYWEPDAEQGEVELEIRLNDYFAPASDAETIPWEDTIGLLKTLCAIHRTGGKRSNIYDVLYQWAADRRGVENIYWKDRLDRENTTAKTEEDEG